MSSKRALCSAHCRACNQGHSLGSEPAIPAAMELMKLLRTQKNLSSKTPPEIPDKALSTASLYGSARGKMFGVLLCRSQNGEHHVLKAFSGQFNGHWEVAGWVPPLFSVQAFYRLTIPVEKQIKALGRNLENVAVSGETRPILIRERKELSQQLMKKIHALYQLHNFRGQQCALADLFPEGNCISTGTGDCCAPKLLNYAAANNLQPLGIAEFYWGRTNRSKSRREGEFYAACSDKCGPILGYLLCGSER